MTRILWALLLAGVTPALTPAEGQGRGAAPAPQTAKEAARMDLTGNWVSVVTEDWRWRMVTPLKGDAASIPISAAARKIVDAWDPAKDESAGLQCKAYGAPAIMRRPGRLRISWQDANTLKIETDTGTQTRLFHFGSPTPQTAKPSWQGYSAAKWEPRASAGGLNIGLGTSQGARSRSLEVVTTRLRSGYLRANGVPYSEQATVTEYYDRFTEPDGQDWFTVTTVVEDPAYLYIPFVTTTDFKKEPDGSRWNPSPCSAR